MWSTSSNLQKRLYPEEDRFETFQEEFEEDVDASPCKKIKLEPSVDEVYEIEQVEHVQVLGKGLFFGGGVGTYVFLGKTNAGKNYMLDHSIKMGMQKANLKWDNIVVFSTTAGVSGNYEWLRGLVDKGKFVIVEDEEELHSIVEHRRSTVKRIRGAKGIPSRTKDEYIRKTSILVIVDDFAGITNTSTSTGNRIFNLVSTSRHLGIWLCLLTQYSKTIGPAWWQNCRAVVSFDSSIRTFQGLSENVGDEVKELPKTVQRSIQRWPSEKRYGFTIWWNFWFGYDKPRIPWTMYPVNEKSLILQRNLTVHHDPSIFK